jgi:hypothetical protein
MTPTPPTMGNSPRNHIRDVVTAHGSLTEAVAEASRLMSAHGQGAYAVHLDHHRAELNVAIGELALWLESFGHWANVDVGDGIRGPAAGRPDASPKHGSLDAQLLTARETLKARRANLLSHLANARSTLRHAGLPAEEITAYRRVVRLWAGEAIDVVSGVHRLTLADRYIRSLAQLNARRDQALRRDATDLLRQWMGDLEEVDREGELALAESCGYGEVVQSYLAAAHAGEFE